MCTGNKQSQIKRGGWICCWITLFCSFAVFAAVPPSSPQFLQQTITTLYKARINIVTKQRQEEKQSLPAETDRQDFLLFLSYLDGRIYYYCDQLKKSEGEGALAGLPCPVPGKGSPGNSEYDSIPEFSTPTEGEKTEDLETGFSASLGEFDDMLLKEQDQIARHVPRERGNSEEGSGSGGKGQGGGNGAKGTGAKGAGGRSSAESGQKNGSAGGGDGQGFGGIAGSGQSRLPPAKGNKDLSQNDDDIVARQLKEAAEQETDPEVKARLWEEYRKYKGK